MKKIPLTLNKFTLINDEDFFYLNQWKWYINNGYAVRSVCSNGKRKKVYMHRVLMAPSKEMEIDHIDGNRLNNQRGNLRIVTRAQNQMNRKKHKVFTSIYKGVGWNKASKKWCASIEKNGKRKWLGVFTSEIDAAKAYNKKAKELFSEFAYLNDIK